MTDKTFDEKFAEAKAHDLKALWQVHRSACLRLAVDMGCDTAENAIALAEQFGDYILNGKPQP